MSKISRPFIISFAIILFVLGWLTFSHNLTWIAISDGLFLAGLPFLIIGCFLWVFSSGFFDTFQASMHQAFRRKKATETDFMPLSEVGQKAYLFWLMMAGILLLGSVLSLAVVWFF